MISSTSKEFEDKISYFKDLVFFLLVNIFGITGTCAGYYLIQNGVLNSECSRGNGTLVWSGISTHNPANITGGLGLGTSDRGTSGDEYNGGTTAYIDFKCPDTPTTTVPLYLNIRMIKLWTNWSNSYNEIVSTSYWYMSNWKWETWSLGSYNQWVKPSNLTFPRVLTVTLKPKGTSNGNISKDAFTGYNGWGNNHDVRVTFRYNPGAYTTTTCDIWISDMWVTR